MFSKLFIAALFVNNVLCYYLNRKQAFIVYETSDFYVIFNAEKDTANYFGVTWANGQSYCQKKYGSDLATVDTAEKQKQIDDVYLSDNNYYAVWIGLYANGGKYSFKDGTQINGYTNWKPGFPRSSASGRCVMNYGKNNPVNVGWYGWADWSCGENSANYVCNKADVATVNPTSMPTEAPTEPLMLVDNVCELLDIDFFLNTCSLHHNGLKSKIGENDAKDVVLTARVTALETKVSTDKTETNAKISALQTQITNLKNTVQSSFQALATSLGNLGSSAKSVPIFNVDGEIVGQEKLLFTTLQAQYLIILSLLFNALLIVGIILYCCIINGGYSPKKRAYNHVNNFDSSDSEAISH